MEYFIIALLVIIVIVLIGLFISAKKPTSKVDQSEQFLQNDLANLRRDIGALSDNLRKTFDERLDKTQDSVHRQLSESSKIINDVSARLTKLDETNKRVVDVADELKTLQNILSNPKQRGVFGEYYLASVLENILPPNQWQAQYKFKDGEIVDAAIFLVAVYPGEGPDWCGTPNWVRALAEGNSNFPESVMSVAIEELEGLVKDAINL